MPKRTVHIVVLFVAAVALTGSAYLFATKEERSYQRVAVGMSLEQVEAILGPGEVTPQANVMQYPDGYVVTGDVIYRWQSGHYDTWVAFKDGKVCEKYLDFWGYL